MNGKRTMNRRYGNAQTIGTCLHQNTYFMVRQERDCLLAVLSEGAIDSVTGAYGAILSCETVLKGFSFARDVRGELERQFHWTAVVLNERLYKGRAPRISLLAACFRGPDVTYRRVGDLSLACFDGKDLTVPEPESGELKVSEGGILLCNQGVWQALNEIEIGKLMAGRTHPYKKAQKMIEAINQRNLKDQKSTVLVIVK